MGNKKTRSKKKINQTLLASQAILIFITAALLLVTVSQVVSPKTEGYTVTPRSTEVPINGYLPPLDTRVPYTIQYYNKNCGICNSIGYGPLEPGEIPFGADLRCTNKYHLAAELVNTEFPVAESMVTPSGINFIETCSIILFISGPGGENGNAMVVFTDNLEEWQDNVIWSSIIPHTDLEDHTTPFVTYPNWIRFIFRADARAEPGETYYLVIADSHNDLVHTYSYPIMGEENPDECPNYEDGILYRYMPDYHDLWNYSWKGFTPSDLVFWMVASLKKPDLTIEVGKEIITASGSIVTALSAAGIGVYRRYRI